MQVQVLNFFDFFSNLESSIFTIVLVSDGDDGRGQDRSERVQLRQDVKRLRKELSERETSTTEQILHTAQVVLCTLTGAASRYFQVPIFSSLVVIDHNHRSISNLAFVRRRVDDVEPIF